MSSKHTILIVDDVNTNVEVLAAGLSEQYNIKRGYSGADCIRLANLAPQPDLILLDIIMPCMNGYETFWQEEAKVPWLYNANLQTMISYDDPASVLEKCEYINLEELAGAMFWEFSGDKYGALQDVVYNAMCDSSGTDSGDEIVGLKETLNNFPNPFNPNTNISFQLSLDCQDQDVILKIYNIMGQKIKRFSINNNQTSVNWDGTDENNQPVPTGIYLYLLISNGKRLGSNKCLLLK